jgi:hypothetical protein
MQTGRPVNADSATNAMVMRHDASDERGALGDMATPRSPRLRSRSSRTVIAQPPEQCLAKPGSRHGSSDTSDDATRDASRGDANRTPKRSHHRTCFGSAQCAWRLPPPAQAGQHGATGFRGKPGATEIAAGAIPRRAVCSPTMLGSGCYGPHSRLAMHGCALVFIAKSRCERAWGAGAVTGCVPGRLPRSAIRAEACHQRRLAA